MSGSGGGGWAGEPGIENCSELSESTILNSPQRAVLETLQQGDRLGVRLNRAGRGVIVEAFKDDQVAGTITSSIIQRLVECIGSGHKYVAEVLDVKGGACRVWVRLK